MPILLTSDYQAKGPFRSAFFNTVYPALTRSVKELNYTRERISTADGDFLDLDWSKVGSNKLVLTLHGLEGQSDRAYIRGMIKHFNGEGWDGLAMNYRGCSGETNLRLQTYHMAATGDVHEVLTYVTKDGKYEEVVIIGFSLGGNLTLRLLAEVANDPPTWLKAAVAFSVPCDISTANIEIHRWFNYLYLRRFLNTLNEKAKLKAKQFPDKVQLPTKMPRTFYEFDDWFTGPIHGFKNGADYYAKANSLQILDAIKIPVLLVNASDDTFLSQACYPVEIAKESQYLFFERPKHGGHVGFGQFDSGTPYWSERRAYQFVKEILG
ncbi:MAG: alpha/beta fold hydrolase [Saprospiraceae bacterium]|nr:alpha/beta fold hydrolase [Saprospiraceae bacterium]